MAGGWGGIYLADFFLIETIFYKCIKNYIQIIFFYMHSNKFNIYSNKLDYEFNYSLKIYCNEVKWTGLMFYHLMISYSLPQKCVISSHQFLLIFAP